MTGTAQQHAAGTVPPRPRERGQAGNGTGCVAATAHPLHAVVQPDGRWPGGSIVARQIGDLLHGNTADLRGALWRPLQRTLTQSSPAQRVLRDVVVIQPVMRDQFMHQRQRQGSVGARAQGDVFMALVGGLGTARVDADDARALALGLLHMAPEMQVAGNRVAAPDQDQLRFGKELDLHADLAAQRLHHGFGAGRRTDGALQLRGAELVKKARRHAFALDKTHGAGIAVGKHRLRVAGGNGSQPPGDVVERLVPTHGLEPACALGPDAPQRLQQALGMVGPLGVTRHLGTQRAFGVAMRGVAVNANGATVFHRGEQRAGVRAVVRAGAAHHAGNR